MHQWVSRALFEFALAIIHDGSSRCTPNRIRDRRAASAGACRWRRLSAKKAAFPGSLGYTVSSQYSHGWSTHGVGIERLFGLVDDSTPKVTDPWLK